MKNKYFYPIFKLKAKSWIRYWLLKKTESKGKLSEILTGFSFNLQNTLRQKFVKFEIEGNSIQDGEPSPENEVPILSSGENVNLFDMSTATINYNGNTALSITGQMLIGNGTPRAINAQLMEKDITEIVHRKKQVYCTYKLFNGEFNDVIRVNVLNANNSVVDRISLPCQLNYTENYTYKLMIMSNSSTLNTFDFKMGVKVESGSTATPYSPFGMGSITEKITNGDNTEEQTYTIPTQQPMRSIGDVRDCFVKVNGTWYERHMPYIESYNGETLPQDVYNEIDGVKYCNEKSMSTTGQFSTGASVQYVDENNWNDLPCTQAQIDILENRPYTYEGQTNVYSTDVVVPYLEIQYWESDTNG